MRQRILCFFIIVGMFSIVVGCDANNIVTSKMRIIHHGSREQKVIALTFDDGPHSEYTQQILGLLKQYQVKATFFVLGQQVVEHPEIVEAEYLEGHEIGNHSYFHINIRKSTKKEIEQQIVRTQEVIFWITGNRPKVFRPPFGYYNKKVIEIAEKQGCELVLWTYNKDSRDWSLPGVNRIAKAVLKDANNGDIILMHDSVEGNSQTVDALKIILPQLKERGFRFVTVSELIKINKRDVYETSK